MGEAVEGERIAERGQVTAGVEGFGIRVDALEEPDDDDRGIEGLERAAQQDLTGDADERRKPIGETVEPDPDQRLNEQGIGRSIVDGVLCGALGGPAEDSVPRDAVVREEDRLPGDERLHGAGFGTGPARGRSPSSGNTNDPFSAGRPEYRRGARNHELGRIRGEG